MSFFGSMPSSRPRSTIVRQLRSWRKCQGVSFLSHVRKWLRISQSNVGSFAQTPFMFFPAVLLNQVTNRSAAWWGSSLSVGELQRSSSAFASGPWLFHHLRVSGSSRKPINLLAVRLMSMLNVDVMLPLSLSKAHAPMLRMVQCFCNPSVSRSIIMSVIFSAFCALFCCCLPFV